MCTRCLGQPHHIALLDVAAVQFSYAVLQSLGLLDKAHTVVEVYLEPANQSLHIPHL